MTEPPAAAPAQNLPEYSVSEISFRLKRVVEESFDYVRVRGEISGFTQARSGHLYMSLKDEKAVLDAVCWKGIAAGIRFRPEDGLEVVCTGKLSTYPGRSRYQLVIERMEPAGIGALMALLEERRKKLQAEGLFEAGRKQPLPYLPDVIGVVTSPTGAVIRDILHRLRDRFPRRVLVWPVRVQGDGAAEEVAAAIEGFNRLPVDGSPPRPDLLIVARGGGSIEDLWAFNEEVVVRAAAASEIPLISAVGHETDTTLIDHAADRRAPTPSAAAEIAVPVRVELAGEVANLGGRQAGAVERLLAERRRQVEGLARGLRGPRDLLALASQRFDDAGERLDRGLLALVAQKRARLQELGAMLRPRLLRGETARLAESLDALGARLARTMAQTLAEAERRLKADAQLLESLSYENVLARGYAVVREAGGPPLTSTAKATPGLGLELQFQDGRVAARVEDGAAPRSPARPRRQRKPKPDDQGQLF
jgi:exodeoxyribonuclease VII large subunit